MFVFTKRIFFKTYVVLVAQGEVGPPGKPGPEGGLGLVGNVGPRGITVQGKEVRKHKPIP